MANQSDSVAEAVNAARADIKHVVEVAEAVRNDMTREAASYTIISAATQRVQKRTDATSAGGRILLANILSEVAWKVGNSHCAHESLRAASRQLNPAPKSGTM